MACGGCKKNKNTQTGNKSAAPAPKVALFNINDKVYTLSSNGKIGNQTRWKYTARYIEDVREVNGAFIYRLRSWPADAVESGLYTYEQALAKKNQDPVLITIVD